MSTFRRRSALLGVIAVFAIWILLVSASAKEEEQRMFIGAEKCKICHKTPKQGEQYPIWLKGPHAKAYEILAGEEAKAIAKERGIEDPQSAAECLKCHVTAHGVDEKYLGPKYNISEGVSCESCHGAGQDYSKRKTMIAIFEGEIDPASVGLIKPDEKVCVQCHNKESPTHKEFAFDQMAKKIAHPIPEARKAAEKGKSEAEADEE